MPTTVRLISVRNMAIAAANGTLALIVAWSEITTASVQCWGRPSTWAMMLLPRVNTNTSRNAASSACRHSGTTTLANVRAGEAPSVSDASVSSRSTRLSDGNSVSTAYGNDV